MYGNEYFIGLDLGQAQDYTALCVLEQHDVLDDQKLYHLRHLERFPLGTSYPQIVSSVSDLMQRPPLYQKVRLVLDFTGVGAPVADMFTAKNLAPVRVSITGGDKPNSEKGILRVPKRDLVTNLQVLFQNGLLKIAEGLAEGPQLVKELLNFKVKINLKTAHDSYEAWREGIHDDIVLAVALAAWYAEKAPRCGVWGMTRTRNQFSDAVIPGSVRVSRPGVFDWQK
jgi:hypothetical protein